MYVWGMSLVIYAAMYMYMQPVTSRDTNYKAEVLSWRGIYIPITTDIQVDIHEP